MARAYRHADGVPADYPLAARLFRLAADRGDPAAQWELAEMMQLGLGIARDPASALNLLHSSADAGEGPAMNILGVSARDGIARPRNDVEAVNWFIKAAAWKNGYALSNLGRMYWEGRGGLAADHVQAVHLWREAAYHDNPWGQFWLADALEKGDGCSPNAKEALDLYRAVAAQDAEPEPKRRAAAILSRLGNGVK